MIATLLPPSTGSVLIDDAPVVAGRTVPQVGYVYQKDTLFPWRTVADNIGYGLELAGTDAAQRRERVARAVARAGLEGFERAYPSALSGGMRQRASLMRTLVKEPQILLMDEPVRRPGHPHQARHARRAAAYLGTGEADGAVRDA